MGEKKSGGGDWRGRGFTLIELVVVIGVITIVTAILLPVLGKARRQARTVVNMNNQRQVVACLDCFASDNDESYPESVATIGTGKHWNWQEPMMLTGTRERHPRRHRSMSAYLRSYIPDAGTMFCPCAPRRYKYFQRAWDAGDDWDNPDTPETKKDSLVGTYCFYWNYIGCLEEGKLFRGPSGPEYGRGESRLLVSDYFGYGHWRNKEPYGPYETVEFYTSCEKFKGCSVLPETWVSSAFWLGQRRRNVKLRAGYTDGHVETFAPSAAVPMKVSITADGSKPYPDGMGGGIIYLPDKAVD